MELSIEQGRLRGCVGTDIKGSNFLKFKGIPYARPPLGDLRFKAPQPPEKWAGVLDASKEGDASYHCDVVRENIMVGSENCLVLNVYTRKLGDGKNLRPVMVWIHGGGFVWGSGSEELYGPDFLMTEDIVYVTINYRLGMLGFLNFEDPSLGVPGNAGFKDMIMGLKWVQRNISAFGGDPNNVTIFGESAGGASVHLLTLSPLAKGLFHKAIVQSACALNPGARGTKGARHIAKALNLEGADDKTVLEHLKTKTFAEIFEIQKKIVDPLVANEIRPFGPVVESGDKKAAFLTQEPYEIILSGNFNQVPVMIGFTSREGMLAQMFKDCRKDFSVQDHIPWTFGYSKEEAKAVTTTVKKFYFGNEEPSADNVVKAFDLASDVFFLYGIHKAVGAQYSRSKAPIYVYEMTIETELNFFKNLLKITEPGVCHADDIGYLFNHFVTPKITPGSAADIGRSRFVKLWTNFAKFGNPTPDQNDKLLKTVWKPVTKPEIDVLDIGTDLKMVSNPYRERIQFWEKLYSESPAGRNKEQIVKNCQNSCKMKQPELTIEQGKLLGSTGKDIRGIPFYKFQGIPYAKPPLGHLRFKAPEPPEHWEGVLDATKPGNVCYQRDLFRQKITGSENCLVLNVYTRNIPDGIHTSLYPVLVWIHGGYFIFGSGNDDIYGPEFLLSENLVLVTVNYRLGMLGFLCLEDLALEVPGNAGLKDIVMALKWVQRNIYKFCGNPHNVTIFGQDAGGSSVHLLFLSPLTAGLFHRAIAQSGCAVNPWARGTRGGNTVAEVLKIGLNDERELLDCLMTKTVEEILEIQEKIVDKLVASEVRPFGYVLESSANRFAFITEEPLQAMLGGRFNHVPLIVGFTSSEGMEIYKNLKNQGLPPLETFIPWSFNYNMDKSETDKLRDRLKKFYFEKEAPLKQVNKIFDLISDSMFIFPIIQTVMILFHKNKAPTYVYMISAETKLNFYKKLAKIKEPGVSHFDDIGYLFKTFKTPELKPGSVEEVVVTKLIKLWSNFATFGEPTPHKRDSLLKVKWKPMKKHEIEFLDIGRELKVSLNPVHDRMFCWKGIFSESPTGKRTECPFLKQLLF
ncbi:alpha-esterase like protein E3 isoform X1 [Tribolium castaneum]